MKFTPAGGRVELGARGEGANVMFWVRDTGSGIPPEQLPRVFERFWQARDRPASEGAGLGLAIAKGIIEAHGGRISIESRLGEGTQVSFTVPRSP
jgi:signal transduction histidine kinase